MKSQEIIPDPTPETLVRDAETEAQVFAQASNVDRLLAMLSAADAQGSSISEDDDLMVSQSCSCMLPAVIDQRRWQQQLYQQCILIRPKIVKLLDKYSQKQSMFMFFLLFFDCVLTEAVVAMISEEDLANLHDKFKVAKTAYDQMLEESYQRNHVRGQDQGPGPYSAPLPLPQPQLQQQQQQYKIGLGQPQSSVPYGSGPPYGYSQGPPRQVSYGQQGQSQTSFPQMIAAGQSQSQLQPQPAFMAPGSQPAQSPYTGPEAPYTQSPQPVGQVSYASMPAPSYIDGNARSAFPRQQEQGYGLQQQSYEQQEQDYGQQEQGFPQRQDPPQHAGPLSPAPLGAPEFHDPRAYGQQQPVYQSQQNGYPQ